MKLTKLYADAFRGLPPTVWRYSIGLLVNRAGTMVLPFLSLYLIRELGFGTADASVILLAFGLGSVVGAYLGGLAAGRFGPFSVQVGSLAASAVGFLVLGQLRSFAALVTGMFVVSAISDAYRPACMTAIIEASPGAIRARSMGLMRLAANAGMAIGPAAGGLLASVDYGWIFVGDAVTCGLAALWLIRAVDGGTGAARGRESAAAAATKSLWRDGPFLGLLGLMLVAIMVLFQIFSTMPLYLSEVYLLDERRIGLIFAFNAVLIVAFEMLLIKAFERQPPARLVGVGMFLLCAGFGLMPLGRSVAFALLTVVVWTVGEMLMIPFANVLVAERAGSGKAGTAMGMYASMYSVALILAPVVGLRVYERYGGDVLWTAAGLIGIPLWILTAVLARTGERSAPR
ncbi:MAG: MFS transporter [Thermoanaerobaculia bacterium]